MMPEVHETSGRFRPSWDSSEDKSLKGPQVSSPIAVTGMQAGAPSRFFLNVMQSRRDPIGFGVVHQDVNDEDNGRVVIVVGRSARKFELKARWKRRLIGSWKPSWISRCVAFRKSKNSVGTINVPDRGSGYDTEMPPRVCRSNDKTRKYADR
jgi:hypothetical protein